MNRRTMTAERNRDARNDIRVCTGCEKESSDRNPDAAAEPFPKPSLP